MTSSTPGSTDPESRGDLMPRSGAAAISATSGAVTGATQPGSADPWYDATPETPESPDAMMERLVDAVVDRLEQRVVDELERRGRRQNWSAF